jgi:hypothetical protein
VRGLFAVLVVVVAAMVVAYVISIWGCCGWRVA